MAYNTTKNAPRDQLSDGPIGSYDSSKDSYASLDVTLTNSIHAKNLTFQQFLHNRKLE